MVVQGPGTVGSRAGKSGGEHLAEHVGCGGTCGPYGPSPMSSACLLSVEKLYPKNNFNQRNFLKNAEAKKNGQTGQNNNS